MEANNFELRSLSLHVTYSSASFTGQPQLSYKKGKKAQIFLGEQIHRQQSEIGTLVSVTLRTAPDLKTVLFTLLVPQVNVPDDELVKRGIPSSEIVLGMTPPHYRKFTAFAES